MYVYYLIIFVYDFTCICAITWNLTQMHLDALWSIFHCSNKTHGVRPSEACQLHPTSLMFQAPSGFPQGSLRVPSFLFRTCCTSLRTCYTNLSFPMSSLEPVTDCHSAFYQDAKPEALSRLFWIVSSFWASWNKFSKGWTCERALKSISPFHSTSPRDKRQAFLKIYPYAAKKISQACRQFMHTAIKVYRNPVAPEGKYAFEAAWLQSAGP